MVVIGGIRSIVSWGKNKYFLHVLTQYSYFYPINVNFGI